MRALSRLSKNKNAVSIMVAYVLLISITIALSVLIYNWLRFYVGEENIPECSDGVSVIIKSYECNATNELESGKLSVVLKNKGRFTVDGYTLRVHDKLGADFGFYVFDKNGTAIAPGGEYEKTYEFSDYSFDGYSLNRVAFVEVQPFVMDGDKVSCKSYASQDVSCD